MGEPQPWRASVGLPVLLSQPASTVGSSPLLIRGPGEVTAPTGGQAGDTELCLKLQVRKRLSLPEMTWW